MTFDETPTPSNTSPLVDDDLDEDEAIKITKKKNLEDDIMDETLEIDEIVNIKRSRNHSLENVIGNLNQRTLRSQAQNQSNFFCFISTIEPKNVTKALGDESWIVAMQEELNQFIANDIWELVPQPRNMKIIGTKWVFRNKLDENGVVSQNKARLVAQGYNQQEGIDYDETYAPVARLESIRILLAYACALDFKQFQMDVKSAFLNGFINEEVYVAQPSGFIDFEKPDHFYKLKKALYGLKQAPKAWYDRLKGHRDHVSACLCHMLYCIESSTPYNLAFFILKRVEKTRNKPKEPLPYGMLLSRLFKHVVSVFLELATDNYLLFDHVMHPLAPHYERKTRPNHGKKRPRESNASSSFATQNYPSLSLPLDVMIDENDDESSHPNSTSPSQQVTSSSTVYSRVRQNLSHKIHNLDTFLSKTINL
uniref:Retrovirus-related Pol polyprotein from transposon TNT 1-94 n=1 Tax=Tanacetum cinerariifolium TaxID=118510 RepID=A0A6L2K900_TANCI|nr:retrovirus-related Pol polyprotein from transposon TNT 1-94 [Tanacetum cinerariifolium]